MESLSIIQMKIFNQQQAIALIRVLTDIAWADGKIDEREQAYLDQLYAEAGLGEDERKKIGQFSSLLALTIIRDFTAEQKERLAQLMGQMIIIDRDINYNEVKIYNAVNEYCKMNADFNEDDYPEYTRS